MVGEDLHMRGRGRVKRGNEMAGVRTVCNIGYTKAGAHIREVGIRRGRCSVFAWEGSMFASLMHDAAQ